MNEMDEIVEEFLVESHENLDNLDTAFVELEKNPTDRETLSAIFRTMHTIKGTCGFLGFTALESLTHSAENLLSLLRDGHLLLDQESTSALLSTVDVVRKLLCTIEETGNEGNHDASALVETLKRLADPDRTTDSPVEPLPEAEASASDPETESEHEEAEESGGAELLSESAATTEDEEIAVEQEPASRRSGTEANAAPAPADSATETTARKSSVTESSIRVDVGLIDKLMNLVGELVLSRNQVLQHASEREDSAFQATSQRLNLITTELQEEVMKTRMQPIGNVWTKFPRIVRDLAVACGKSVRVEMEGKDTELDRTIIEAIKDPLTHLVRNSVDHGIEPPERRVAKGKPEEGCLTLRAAHEGGQVNIEVADDGGGLSLEKIRNKAIQRGLVSTDQVARMSDRDVAGLIFLPGFSTADKISNVSGRGVGMDVVKTNIEKIGGTVDIQSVEGRGTVIRIKIPLTLAIIPALMVKSAGDRFAIPQVNLVELVRIQRSSSAIESIHGCPVYRLRGNLLPLVYLRDILSLDDVDPSDGPTSLVDAEDDGINIVVLQADDRLFGLVVDEISDTEEIVVKPLSTHLKTIPAFAGATIMGDGKVALILDVLGIARESGASSERSRTEKDSVTTVQATEGGVPKQTLLLFQAGQQQRMAIPLALVDRLEEFDRDAIEWSGRQPVVQYRSGILPLVVLRDLVEQRGSSAQEDAPTVPVVVLSKGDRWLGIVVDRILDVTEEALKVERRTSRRGIYGSAVIQGTVTDLVDVTAVVSQVDPDIVGPEAVQYAAGAAGVR